MPHYKAFISYSHADAAWARWLQRSLERYRVPRRLVGSDSPFGPIPARLSPIFRDREDLSTAADLTASIKRELEASETLVVICSPAAARSRWVNEEIRYFRELGRESRILALVVDGDPQAAAGAAACFPEALLQGGDGGAGSGPDGRHEPLAADARRYADGRRLARLKLVAGILGIRLDELRRRDAQRRLRNRAGWLAAGTAVLALVAWLGWSAVSTQEAARRQRVDTEELLGFMLGDLKRLDPIVGLEMVDKDDPVLAAFRDELGFDALDDEALVGQALSWREAGMELHQRGSLTQAMEQFQRSRAALVELHRREGSTRRALFELGQAEFWVGYVHLDRGELDEAQASFARYGAVTRRLVNADPNNAEMVMELAYTLVNLGGIERARQDPDTGRILELFQSSVQYNQMALVLDSGNEVYQRNLVTTLAFLADAWLETCDLGNAFSLRTQSAELSRTLYVAAPEDPVRAEELAYALSGLAGVQQAMGLSRQAAVSLEESGRLLEALAASDPAHVEWRWEALLRRQRLWRLAAAEGHADEAWAQAQELSQKVDVFLDEYDADDVMIAVDVAEYRADHARLAELNGHGEEARQTMSAVVNDLAGRVLRNPTHRDSLRQLASASFGYWELTGSQPDASVTGLLSGFLSDPARTRSCFDASTAARLAVMRGDRVLASDYTDYVLGRGYFEPGFVRFCRRYALCPQPQGGTPDGS